MRTSDWLYEFSVALQSPTEALKRLNVIESEALSLIRELALTEMDRAQKKRDSYIQSTETTISGRDREADLYTAHEGDEIIRMKGDLAAYSLERDHLRFFIEHGCVNADTGRLHPAGT